MVPTLQTERLKLRAFRDDDLAAYAAMGADAEVMRFIATGETIDRATAWRQMAFFNGHWSLRGYGMWALERQSDGALVGRAGLFDPPGWPGLELGWLLGREFWGQGLAREAARAALQWTRELLTPERLISVIVPGNERSVRVAEALGARLDGEQALNGRPVLVYAHARAA